MYNRKTFEEWIHNIEFESVLTLLAFAYSVKHMAIRLEANQVRKLGRSITNGQGYDLPASLSDLGEVVIINPQDGDVLTYDAATGKWINKQP